MCGIYGCIGSNAADYVLEGLRKLEYRGYDSAGLAAIFPKEANKIRTEKTVGYVSDLVSKVNGRFKDAYISIGHTRWATHGQVNYDNAHPFSSTDGSITLVHNGIIENSLDLLKSLNDLGYNMESETDTEVIVHLLDYEIKNQSSDKCEFDAFCNVISRLEGSWAIAAIISGLDGILISRNGAPLVIGKGADNISVASDTLPFYGACSQVCYMEDGTNIFINKDGIIKSDRTDSLNFVLIEGVYDEMDPGIYPHMMLKEIHDQPLSLSNAFNGRISADGKKVSLGGFKLSAEEIKKLDRINLVACGTAYYASAIISSYIRKYSNIRVEAFLSSEFPAKSVCSSNTLTIGISQSGETKDTLDALMDAKKFNSHVSSICNVIGSTIARFTGNGAYLYAGSEYAVASTKVFTNMMAVGLMFALTISDISDDEQASIVKEMRRLPNLISKQLQENTEVIKDASEMISKSKSPIFIGRGGFSSYMAQEGALKMMEISYIPCLSLPGGELKHGPIALLEKNSPVIAVAPKDSHLRLTESSIRECKSRGAKIILITDDKGPICEFSDYLIKTCGSHPDLSPFITLIPLQLLAYQTGIERNCNIDRPRNLAKSVTVV